MSNPGEFRRAASAATAESRRKVAAMARLIRDGADAAYALQQRWMTNSLVHGQSLLTDRTDVWTKEVLDELVEHFIEAPDYSEKVSFVDKLERQLAEASDTAVLLMAELFIVNYLIVASEATGPKRKRQVIEAILSWRFDDLAIPEAVDAALARGIAHPGQYANSYPNVQVAFLIRFSLAALENGNWLEVAGNPWELRAFVESIKTDAADDAARLAVLHLTHPDTFDPIVNPRHKHLILDRFLPGEDKSDLDRALLEARAMLEPDLGLNFTWWDEPLVHRWNRDPKKWANFCHWAARFREVPEFDESERTYKLELVNLLQEARDKLLTDAVDWQEEFKRAIRKSNLVAVMTKTRVADWVEESPQGARRTFAALWNTDGDPAARLAAMDEARPAEHLSTTGERLSLGSVLLMADGAEGHPPLKISVLRQALKLADWSEPPAASVPDLYVLAMTLFDELCQSVPSMRDWLDAQGAVWCLTSWKGRPESWSEAEWAELEAYRGGDAGPNEEAEDGSADERRSELERRRLRYEAIRSAWEADEQAQRTYEQACSQLDGAADLAQRLLADLTGSGDLDAFRSAVANSDLMPSQLRRGSHPNYLAHAVNTAGPGLRDVVAAICAAYAAPDGLDDAVSAIDRLHAAYSTMPDVAGSYVGMTPLAASVFWSAQDRRALPPLWASLERVLQRLGWLDPAETPAERYRAYAELLLPLDDEPLRAVYALQWFGSGGLAGIDPAAIERCRENQSLAVEFYAADKEYADQAGRSTAERNARSLVGDLRYLADSIALQVGDALDCPVRAVVPPVRYGTELPFRHDCFAGWQLTEEGSRPSVRVWVTVEGVTVGLHPGWTESGWYDRAAELVHRALPDDLQLFRLRTGAGVYHLEARGRDLPGGEFVVGRSVDLGTASSPAIEGAVLDAAISLKPVIAALRGQPAKPADLQIDQIGGDIDHLDAAAADLLIDRDELERITGLLEDRRQVVLYGPPGTGKTFLAKRLARALAADRSERHAIVQFHPATTYEDFIEGLRPVVEDGQVSYELRRGPLIRMAESARSDPSGTYVIVIDEINRANLPKVLGELLFLLEYRDEPVRLLYRPDEPFTLPKNLWFIGTMNTADRSIALVDAAMRRRFHFIGFFPHHGPMRGLLRRWLVKHKRPEHVADFVDAVNEELRKSLGDHLLLGPSFFMKDDLSRPALQKIWDHNAFPYLEEQFWGQDELDDWSWSSVAERYASLLDPDSAPAAGEPVVDDEVE